MESVLIVDDDDGVRRMLVTLFTSRGLRVHEASDGAEALAVASAQRPELIISDIMMPTMDGYEFIRRLRADRRNNHIRIIFLTAEYHEREANELALASGVATVLRKTGDPKLILAAVDEVLASQPPEVQTQSTGSFDARHIRVMTAKVSEQAARLQAANARLAALCELNLQLASERDEDTMCHWGCRRARELIGTRYALLCVERVAEDGKPLLTVAGMTSDGAARVSRLVRAAPGFGEILRRGKAAQIDFAWTEPGRSMGIPVSPGGECSTGNALMAPIVYQSSTYGWLAVIDKLGTRGFDADDEQVIVMLAAQIGSNLQINRHAAQLQVEIHERTQAAAHIFHLNRMYAMLSGINSLILRVRDRDQLFRETCRLAIEQGRFRMAWIGTFAPAAGTITPVAWDGTDTQMAARIGVPVDLRGVIERSLVKEAISSRQPVVCNDVEAQSERLIFGRQLLIDGHLSIAVLPLIVGGEPLGTLSLTAAERAFFSSDELRLLEELASDVSFALDHIGKSEKLDYLAYYDSLTGLANRTLLLQRLAQNVADADLGGIRLAVVVVELDHLESINESFGRSVGDQVLCVIAERLSQRVGNISRIARVGADEFAVVIPDMRSESDVAREVAEWSGCIFGESLQLESAELRLSGKAGIAIFPSDARDADGLLSCARAALKNSRASADHFLFYRQDMSERTAERLGLEIKLRRAIENQEFILHYQPKMEAASGRIAGLEALLRWRSPELGLVPPARFISLLEETGMIVPVGAWVLQQAIADRTRWLEARLSAPRIAVNVSTFELRRQDFVRSFAGRLSSAGAEPGIDIEVTETLIMEDVESNIGKLAAIRDLGVSIAIDDFGTGYSSLAYLARLPVNTLKIDRSFVATMLTDPGVLMLVRTIISMARSLKLTTVAEGVETEEQARMLRLLQCEQMQGYLFCRPTSFDEMTARLGRRKS